MDVRHYAVVDGQVNIHTIACHDPATRCRDCWGEIEAATPPAEAATGGTPIGDDLIAEAAWRAAVRDSMRGPRGRAARR